MSLSTSEIKEILAILEDSGWDEARVVAGDVTLTVAKGPGGLLAPPPGAAPASPAPPAAAQPAPLTAPEPAPPAPAPAAEEPASAGGGAEPSGHVVTAPSVGIFWRAPEPGAQPFVEEGATVAEGDTLCICEVMKLMNHVATDVAGTVTAIHATNGEHVEFGAPLFSIDPS